MKSADKKALLQHRLVKLEQKGNATSGVARKLRRQIRNLQ